MYKFELADVEKTSNMRKQYHSELIAPRDGMWESFVDMGDHYLITSADRNIGYLVLNTERFLQQFYVENKKCESEVFKAALKQLEIVGAFPTTIEAGFISLCHDHQKSVSVNDIMYHCPSSAEVGEVEFSVTMTWRLLEQLDHDIAIEFAHEAIGADKGWLKGYYADRISKKELFGLWQENTLIATGERRFSPYFDGVADLGMVVANEFRGKGLGSKVLSKLILACREVNINPICSTSLDNLPAQKSIMNSGFMAYHRILKTGF